MRAKLSSWHADAVPSASGAEHESQLQSGCPIAPVDVHSDMAEESLMAPERIDASFYASANISIGKASSRGWSALRSG